MAWENRFIIVGRNGPAPYLMSPSSVPYYCTPLTRPFLVAIAVGFVYHVSRRHIFSACSSSCVVIRHVGMLPRQRRVLITM